MTSGVSVCSVLAMLAPAYVTLITFPRPEEVFCVTLKLVSFINRSWSNKRYNPTHLVSFKIEYQWWHVSWTNNIVDIPDDCLSAFAPGGCLFHWLVLRKSSCTERICSIMLPKCFTNSQCNLRKWGAMLEYIIRYTRQTTLACSAECQRIWKIKRTMGRGEQ